MNTVKVSIKTILLFSGGAAGGVGFGLIVLLSMWLLFGGRGTTSTDGANTSAIGQVAAKQPEPTPTSEKPADAMDNSSSGVKDDPSEVAEKLKRIALAFQNFHDIEKVFAFPRVQDMEVIEPNHRPRPTELSWRVHLLRYLEEIPLYSRFHLDEPWDSEHNRTLIEHMPSVYRLGDDKNTTTRFQVLTGPEMLFGQKNPPRMRDVPDGMRHTILLLVVGTDKAVPWTKPDDVVIDPKNPMESLGNITGRYLPCACVDGQVLMLPRNVEPSKFLALATPGGNEIIDGDTYRREFEEEQSKLSNVLKRMLKP